MFGLWMACILGGSPALALEAAGPAQHEVVRANTLWDLAATYCKDPWQWPRIHMANRDQIKDPNVIQPGQVFKIPCAGKTVVVYPTNAAPAPPPEPAPEPVPEPVPPPAPAPEPVREPLDDLSVRFPGGLTEATPRRTQVSDKWKPEGRVLELDGREAMAAEGDFIEVSLGSPAKKGQRLDIYRASAPQESDPDEDAHFVQKIGVIEVLKRLSRSKYRAMIVRTASSVQVGDMLKRAP